MYILPRHEAKTKTYPSLIKSCIFAMRVQASTLNVRALFPFKGPATNLNDKKNFIHPIYD